MIEKEGEGFLNWTTSLKLALGHSQDQSHIRLTWQDLERIGELLGAYLLSCMYLAYVYEDNLILFVLHLGLVPYNNATRLEPEDSLI